MFVSPEWVTGVADRCATPFDIPDVVLTKDGHCI
jgi:hypothetical protein